MPSEELLNSYYSFWKWHRWFLVVQLRLGGWWVAMVRGGYEARKLRRGVKCWLGGHRGRWRYWYMEHCECWGCARCGKVLEVCGNHERMKGLVGK